MKSEKKSYRRVAAASTTLEILEFLSDQDGPVSGSEVARALDMPLGTVMSHLATQEDARFIKRNNDKFELDIGRHAFGRNTNRGLNRRLRSFKIS